MSTDRPPEGSEQPRIESDEFWPAFWGVICRYSEYLYMMLVFITVLASLNAIAMLLAPQSEGSFVISVMVFVILGTTALGLGFVLYQCRKMKR